MPSMRERTRFGAWLSGELDERGMGVRTLARRIDSEHTEYVRRNLYRYLNEGHWPHRPMRRAIAAALDVPVSELPAKDDK